MMASRNSTDIDTLNCEKKAVQEIDLPLSDSSATFSARCEVTADDISVALVAHFFIDLKVDSN
jgi:hypothetical protein